jgi:hypothetical protein
MGNKRKKYTRAMYHRAKKALSEVPIHEETLRVWAEAVEQIGIDDEERVMALEVTDDGGIKVELAPLVNVQPALEQLSSSEPALDRTDNLDDQGDAKAY